MTRRRAWATALLVGLFTLGLAPAASAADGSLSAIESDGETVQGLLTVRTATPLVDAEVTATLGGDPVTVRLTNEVRTPRSVMLVIDTSGSMGAAGMATVRGAVAQFLRTVPDDVQVGLASFSETSGVDVKPTLDRAAVQEMVDGLTSGGNTDLFGGVSAALGAVARRAGDRSILVLSDGADTIAQSPGRAQRRLAKELRRTGVRFDVIRFNTDDPRAVTTLRSLAAAGTGVVARADDPAQVTRGFEAAASALRSQVSFTVELDRPLTQPAQLVIAGLAGSEAFRAGTHVDPAAVTGAEDPAATSTGAATEEALGFAVDRQRWWLLPLIGAVSIALAFLLLAAAWVFPMKSRKAKRVEQIEDYLPWKTPQRHRAEPQGSVLTARLVAMSDQLTAERKSTPRLRLLLQRADLPISVGEWWLLRALALLAPAVLAWLVTRSVLIGVLTAAAGLFLPPLVLRFLATRRAVKFERQLPDVLFLVATGLSSGFGLNQALDGVVRDAPDPVAAEIARAQAETRLGTDLPVALERVADRMDSTTMRWTVMAMRIQSEVGGNLAETLRTTAHTLRDRESLKRQVRTLSAEGRLSAWILIGLPIGVFFWMMLVNREYISLLWTTLPGMAMSVGTCVLMVIGIFWMKKVVEVEV